MAEPVLKEENNQHKGVVLSGMRPTGELHIGHFASVLANWQQLQREYNSFFFVADVHATTTDLQTEGIPRMSIDMVRDWLAYGIDPETSTIFVQSAVSEHAELSVYLERLTNMGRLRRMPTLKEKLQFIAEQSGAPATPEEEAARMEKVESETSAGLFTYPVLMAADILLYGTTHVPVGEDQVPHIELTREIARRFNKTYGDGIFVVPEPLLMPVSRVRGTDGRKMSKSFGNAISPKEDLGELTLSVRSIVTTRPRLSDRGTPEECPVFDLHTIFNPEELGEITYGCREAAIRCLDCKMRLPQRMLDAYSDYRQRLASFSDDDVVDILREGNGRARVIAGERMAKVRDSVYQWKF